MILFVDLSPGQVAGLVVTKLLSTMCVVQGMMGTSLLHRKKPKTAVTLHVGEDGHYSLDHLFRVSVFNLDSSHNLYKRDLTKLKCS